MKFAIRKTILPVVALVVLLILALTYRDASREPVIPPRAMPMGPAPTPPASLPASALEQYNQRANLAENKKS